MLNIWRLLFLFKFFLWWEVFTHLFPLVSWLAFKYTRRLCYASDRSFNHSLVSQQGEASHCLKGCPETVMPTALCQALLQVLYTWNSLYPSSGLFWNSWNLANYGQYYFMDKEIRYRGLIICLKPQRLPSGISIAAESDLLNSTLNCQ